jgi:acyl-CoA reductase-like NAD-dependent aldehyde dehydrogenase
MTCMELAGILEEAGLPAGVFNVVNGEPDPMGKAMLDREEVRKIHFTGSVRVGKLLMDVASKTVTRLSLELGGNAPVLILPDADLEQVAAGAVVAKYRNAGQVCVSPQRFLVDGSRADEFVERVVPQVEQLRLGPGVDPATDVGPMINERQRDRLGRSSRPPPPRAPPSPPGVGARPTGTPAGSSRRRSSPTSPRTCPCTTRSCSGRSCR